MTLRYIHIRECDEEGEMLQTGGATIAYSVSRETGAIFLNLSRCSVNDQFCRRIGREVAAQRLHDDGPHEILILKDPITETICWWFIKEFGCCLIRDTKGRWLSTFTPVDKESLGMFTYERIPDDEFVLEE